ncbi:MAG: Uma2 family endonuclease [Pyrinomonadaceae bacterium]
METFVIDLPKTWEVGAFELRNGHYVTFEEYLDLDIEGVHLEWEDGKVVGFMANNLRHQLIVRFLLQVLGLFVEKYELGQIVQAGYAMKLDEQKRGREPDLLFVRKQNLERLQDLFLDGPADLAVEIISPESVVRDRKIKFDEYAAAGIAEYWLIDPRFEEADFYRLGADASYHPIPIDNGVFRSDVLEGFFLRTEWLWSENLSTLNALKELDLLA